MLSSPISHLSQELIDKIIDALVDISEPDWPSTRSGLIKCTLVCRAFRSRSQKILFSRVSIDVERIDSFYRILRDNPLIAGYIQDLKLLLTHADYKWMWEDQRFIRIMGLISRPRAAFRKLRMRTKHGIQALGEGQAMIQGFFKPYVAPYITSLDIGGLYTVPIEVFTGCVHLTDLTLSWTELDAASYASPDVEILSRRIYLRSLKYIRSPNILSKLVGWTGSRPYVDISGVRVLTIGTDAQVDLAFEQRIILTTSGSLEELYITDLECHEINYTVNRFVDLQTCLYLRILELDVNLGRRVLTKDGEDDLNTICGILSTIPNSNKLTDFRLTAHVGYWVNDEPEGLLEADWGSLRTQVSRILHTRKSTFSLHMDYLPIDYTITDRVAGDSDDEAEADSYQVRCQDVLQKLVRDYFSVSEQGAVITILTTCNISSYYS